MRKSYKDKYDRLHRVGLYAIRWSTGDKFWAFHHLAHRVNGYYDPKINICCLYNKNIGINIEKLVI